MFLLVFAGLLGGCIAFAALLAQFGFLIALLGSQFIAGLAALGAGMFVAFAEWRLRLGLSTITWSVIEAAF